MKYLLLGFLLAMVAIAPGCGTEYFDKNVVNVPVYNLDGTPALGSDGKVLTVEHKISDEGIWYQRQADMAKLRKPILVLEAYDGKDINLVGVKRLEVWGSDGNVTNLKIYESQWAKMWREWGGIAGMLGGIYVGGQVAVDLADTVGKHAGRNIAVGGDYNQGDGSASYGGDFIGRDQIGGDLIDGDKAGGDINRDSQNRTETGG